MSNELKVHIINIFVNQENKYGNPVGIILDEKQEINSKDRQKIAVKLGNSETVFINDINTGNISMYNPQQEICFAGSAFIATAWFISKINKKPIDSLICMGKKITILQKEDETWLRADLSNTPPWNYEELETAEEVENIKVIDIITKKHTVVWAWQDKEKGIIRARTFASNWGIPEDEGNGSGAMQLAAKHKRKLMIIFGKGSVVYSKPFSVNEAEVGGRAIEKSPDVFQL